MSSLRKKFSAGEQLLPSPRGRGWGKGRDAWNGVDCFLTVDDTAKPHSPPPNRPSALNAFAFNPREGGGILP